jgi:hypothetical protein
VTKGKEYQQAQQTIFETCRSLEDRRLIKMDGPGTQPSSNWVDLVRGWGWNSDQQTEIVRELSPSGAWDTIRLTIKGIEAAGGL